MIPDYCTAVPDRLKTYDMSGCCKLHDMDYEKQIKSRKQADTDFYE